MCLTNFYFSIYSLNLNILKYKNDFQLLNLNERNIGEIYKEFQLIDENEDENIQYFELLNYLKYESTKFLLHIFDIYDNEKIGIKNKIRKRRKIKKKKFIYLFPSLFLIHSFTSLLKLLYLSLIHYLSYSFNFNFLSSFLFKIGTIQFRDFVLMTWNICTIEKASLGTRIVLFFTLFYKYYSS